MIDYPKYKKVLFCTDFSENCDIAFGYAFGIAKRDGSALYILHVMPSPNNYPHYVEGYLSSGEWEKIAENNRKEIDKNFEEKYLNKIKDKSNVHVVIKSGREDEEIIEFAKKENVDIIIVGTQGRKGISHAFLGSVAEKIVRQSLVPVFVIPCKKRRMYDQR
jgi:nucleotide-binding universal stress UspA family protein